MAQIEYQIVPDEYYSIKDINRLIEALEKRMKVRDEIPRDRSLSD